MQMKVQEHQEAVKKTLMQNQQLQPQNVTLVVAATPEVVKTV